MDGLLEDLNTWLIINSPRFERLEKFVIRRNGKWMKAVRGRGRTFVVMKVFLSIYIRLQLLGDGGI